MNDPRLACVNCDGPPEWLHLLATPDGPRYGFIISCMDCKPEVKSMLAESTVKIEKDGEEKLRLQPAEEEPF